jgi:hypothetical protein
MTIEELKALLDDPRVFSRFKESYGAAGGNAVDWFVGEFARQPQLEKKYCWLLNRPTEEEKRTKAIVESAEIASESASAAKRPAEIAADALEGTRSYRQATWCSVAAAVISMLIAGGSLIVAVLATMAAD